VSSSFSSNLSSPVIEREGGREASPACMKHTPLHKGRYMCVYNSCWKIGSEYIKNDRKVNTHGQFVRKIEENFPTSTAKLILLAHQNLILFPDFDRLVPKKYRRFPSAVVGVSV
jgi:hypothetical protein